MRNSQTAFTHVQSSEVTVPTHLADDSLNASTPTRTWSDFLAVAARKTGLTSAMLGMGLGAAGFVSPESSGLRAHAGIIAGEQYDLARKTDGVAFNASNGGRVVSFWGGTGRSSGVLLDAWTVAFTRHQLDISNVDFKIGLKPNFLDETSDSLYSFSSIITHPDPVIDFAIAKLKDPVAGIAPVTFADLMPSQNTNVWLAGYGITGDRTRGYVGQDGFIRAGVSRIRDNAPLLNLPAAYYHNAAFDSLNPDGLRGAGGDSGGAVFTTDGKWLGVMVAAPGPVTGTTTTFAEVTNPYIGDFARANMGPTSVPEPGAVTLIAASTILLGLGRRWMNRKNSASKTVNACVS